jgi:hypothetical protein
MSLTPIATCEIPRIAFTLRTLVEWCAIVNSQQPISTVRAR